MPHNLRRKKSEVASMIPGGSLSAPLGFVGSQICIQITKYTVNATGKNYKQYIISHSHVKIRNENKHLKSSMQVTGRVFHPFRHFNEFIPGHI